MLLNILATPVAKPLEERYLWFVTIFCLVVESNKQVLVRLATHYASGGIKPLIHHIYQAFNQLPGTAWAHTACLFHLLYGEAGSLELFEFERRKTSKNSIYRTHEPTITFSAHTL